MPMSNRMACYMFGHKWVDEAQDFGLLIQRLTPVCSRCGAVGQARRRIDYTRQMWGHALHLNQVEGEPGTYRGLVHCITRPFVGDELLWTTDYGTAVARITLAEGVMDPEDMFRIHCYIIERITT